MIREEGKDIRVQIEIYLARRIFGLCNITWMTYKRNLKQFPFVHAYVQVVLDTKNFGKSVYTYIMLLKQNPAKVSVMNGFDLTKNLSLCHLYVFK